ncbi:hypothetical protein D3C80_1108840 [compost metagenome]
MGSSESIGTSIRGVAVRARIMLPMICPPGIILNAPAIACPHQGARDRMLSISVMKPAAASEAFPITTANGAKAAIRRASNWPADACICLSASASLLIRSWSRILPNFPASSETLLIPSADS